jgi:cytochrome c553
MGCSGPWAAASAVSVPPRWRWAACLAGFALVVWAGRVAAADQPPIDFNRDIRPILAENCFYCHGQDGQKRQADLRLDEREAAVKAGAIVPGDAGASGLLERVRSSDPDVLMPPPSSNRRLSEEQKRLLERWIAEGAGYTPHWAFTPPVRPAVPAASRQDWPRNDIDRFVLARLDRAGLAPSPEADRPTLIRRLHADLVGLPPTPEEVDAFVADTDPQAYEKLVDRLLASPHYGERMALPWLDAARYADSNGFQQDGDTWQWMWRDWVVRALNADMPFDRFSTEQLAGDLLPDATIDQRIATGFNRNHLLNGEGGAIAEEQRFNNLFDRVDTTSTTWLGLTMACAQCHDHKYDPLTQADYYRLLDAFNRVPESGTPTRFSARIRVAPPVLELPSEDQKRKLAELEARMKSLEGEARPLLDAAFAAWRAGLFADGEPADGADLPRNLTPLLRKPEAERTDAEKKSIESQLRSHFDAKIKADVVKSLPPVVAYDAAKKEFDDYKGDQLPRPMVMSDERPRETKVLDRGDYLSPKGDPVVFAPPAFLPPLPSGAPANRLGLALWLFAPEHPLTARVQVNRMWQHFFGNGIVKTTEDMGVQSEYPTHLPLLDWLAVEFRERGWHQKRMHRLFVTSATYRQASRVTAEHLAKDPENRLFARASRFRMPSLVLRDVALAASGLLDGRIGGPPVYPYQPDQIWEALAITKERDFTYPASHGGDLYRRSLYTFWRRTVNPANMFDAANRQTCSVRTSRTCTPLHALTTLNDPTWVEAARVLAERAMKAAPDVDGRLAFAFRRILGRRPTDYDMAAIRRMYDRQLAVYRADAAAAKQLLGVGESPRDESLDPAEHAAYGSVCLGVFNLDEALTRE